MKKFLNGLKQIGTWLGIIIGGAITIIVGIFAFKVLKPSKSDQEIEEQEKENQKAKEDAEKQKEENQNQIDENNKTIEDIKKDQEKIKDSVKEYIKD